LRQVIDNEALVVDSDRNDFRACGGEAHSHRRIARVLDRNYRLTR
jgi:hypothetical protein